MFWKFIRWGGTVAVLAVLALLRFVDDKLPQRSAADVTVRYRREKALTEGQFRQIMIDSKLKTNQIAHHMLNSGKIIEHKTHVHGYGPVPTQALALVLAEMPEVVEFSITPHDD